MGPGPDEDPDEVRGAERPEGGEDSADAGARGEGPADAGAREEEPGYMDRPEEIDPYPLEGEEDEDEFDAEREETGESVTIEIAGLSLYTHHGVSEAERDVGQRLVLDLRLDLGETDATVTDAIEDTVDYGEVCQLVALIAQQRSHKTLERLCGTIADRLLGDYDLEGVWVKATKPEPPIALHVDEVSVEVWREAEE
ncbi:MAG TPA: dihydroneopterin aldolase [Solirubrobacteraceae bacterium]|jgi:dihydroneopterin aldolase